MLRKEYVLWNPWEGMSFSRRSSWLQRASKGLSEIVAELLRRSYQLYRSANGGYELLVIGYSGLADLPESACRSVTSLRVIGKGHDREVDCRSFTRFPALRSLSIGYASKIRHAGAINDLTMLRRLVIEDPVDDVIHVDRMPFLQELYIHDHRHFVGMADAASLRYLALNAPPGLILDIATLPTGITRLSLRNSQRLTTFGDLSRLTSLTYLEVFGLSKLVSLAGVEVCLQMRRIIIENCKNLVNIDDAWSLPQLVYLEARDCPSLKHVRPSTNSGMLTHLFLTGRTRIGNCETLVPSLPSLKFLVC